MTPFSSKAQARMMFAKHPTMAKEWAGKTPNMKDLPQRANMRVAVAKKKRKRGK